MRARDVTDDEFHRREDLERVRYVRWSIWREITILRSDESNSSEALVAELRKICRDIGDRIAAVDRQLAELRWATAIQAKKKDR
jgi:hypothetical protein